MTLHEFVPKAKYITGITNALNAVVTCSDDHNFSDGEIVSFRVSRDFGMTEMNNKQTRVLSHTNTSITTDIDSNNFTPFIYPTSALKYTPPVVVPAGSGIIPDSYPATVNLEDVFDNRRTV